MGLLDRIGKIVFGEGGASAPSSPSYSAPPPSYGGGVQYSLSFPSGSTIVLSLTESGYRQLEARGKRSFLKRCPKDKLVSMIDTAINYKSLEEIAERYSICDSADFSDLHLDAIKTALRSTVDVLYDYPRLRSKTCYIGSAQGYRRKLESLRCGSVATLKDLGIEYICSPSQVKQLGALMVELADSYLVDNSSFIALAIDAFGLFDALVLDADDYKGYKYRQTLDGLKYGESSGFHPKGCDSPESAVYHELGHLLDYLCHLNSSGMERLYCSYTRRDIERELSQYGATSAYEFFAEAFAEARCNPYPRDIANRAMLLLKDGYARVR